ncbi:MAG: iron-sulfur cluster assembly protein [Puniceicoccales bacterium]|jgi:metal-sulfur cluster biosynthetic enzyme|nr:iron-sulfur cluster assembly protein [Puniceicoccales bacterium]
MIDSEFLFQQLKTVEDPDVHVNVVDLGLIYGIEEIFDGSIVVAMTLTSPSCPVGDFLMESVKKTIAVIHPDHEILVNLVWDPPWNRDMITEVGKMELGIL